MARQKKAEAKEPQAPHPAEPPRPPKPPELVCTYEENMAGLAALKAAIYGKRGPMAREIDTVIARMYPEEKA